MTNQLNKKEIERFSRQIILKNIGSLGQKKIINAKVLIVGAGGLGCPVADFLVRAGVGILGIIDDDIVNLSNIHRQSLYDLNDIEKPKVKSAKNKLKKINPKTLIKIHNFRLTKKNSQKIIDLYDFIVDASDNFKTKFLENDIALKLKKFLTVGAISKFDGHIFTYSFKSKNSPCLKCFFQNEKISDDIKNCEYEGVLGTTAGIVGALQANEVLKQILNIGKNLDNQILILDLLNLNFRKVKIKKQKKCLCSKLN